MSADPADALGGWLPLADPATLTGEQRALVDIAFLIGIYHAVCATLTLFSIPAPGQAGHS